MKGVKKENLPSKVCATCRRPFVWRKKWRNTWDTVIYCSDACRTHKNAIKNAGGKSNGGDGQLF